MYFYSKFDQMYDSAMLPIAMACVVFWIVTGADAWVTVVYVTILAFTYWVWFTRWQLYGRTPKSDWEEYGKLLDRLGLLTATDRIYAVESPGSTYRLRVERIAFWPYTSVRYLITVYEDRGVEKCWIAGRHTGFLLKWYGSEKIPAMRLPQLIKKLRRARRTPTNWSWMDTADGKDVQNALDALCTWPAVEAGEY